jgi:hypothetical protein
VRREVKVGNYGERMEENERRKVVGKEKKSEVVLMLN